MSEFTERRDALRKRLNKYWGRYGTIADVHPNLSYHWVQRFASDSGGSPSSEKLDALSEALDIVERADAAFEREFIGG